MLMQRTKRPELLGNASPYWCKTRRSSMSMSFKLTHKVRRTRQLFSAQACLSTVVSLYEYSPVLHPGSEIPAKQYDTSQRWSTLFKSFYRPCSASSKLATRQGYEGPVASGIDEGVSRKWKLKTHQDPPNIFCNCR